MWDRLDQLFRQSSAGRWFYGREQQEQRIIAVLGLLILASLLWLGLWQPVMSWKATASNQHRNALANLEWFELNREQLEQRPDAGRGGEASLRTISQSARTLGLQVNRLQPSDGGVSVVLQNQPFNDVVKFIHQLEERNGVVVERASLDVAESPGRVNANLVLR